MRRYLNDFVRNELYKGCSPSPSYCRRFYPRRKYLDYHMAKAKLADHLAALDQDNVEALIEKWKNHRKTCSSQNANRRTTKKKWRPLKMIVQLTMKTLERKKTKNLSTHHGKESAPYYFATKQNSKNNFYISITLQGNYSFKLLIFNNIL